MSDTTSWHELFSLIGAVQPKLHRVSYNIETIPNAPKHYETNQKKEFIVQWTGPGAFVLKLSDTTSWHVLFSIMAPAQPKLHRVSYSNETIPDAAKRYETHQNMNLGSNAVDLVQSLRKCPSRLCGTNFFH